MTETTRKEVYTRVTERIISDLEQGVRTWLKPWSAEHAAGRIKRPLRHNGTPYRGKTGTNEQGEDTEREIPFMKGYTVFNMGVITRLAAQHDEE